MKCCFKFCKNEVFESLDKCALHCSSETIIDEDKYLSEFDNFFAKYILAKIKKLDGLRCENWPGILQELSLKDISFINFDQNEVLKEILNTKVLYIKNICFPKIKNISLSYFSYITDQFNRIFFENCFFGYDSVVSESHKYYYRECLFNGDLRIKASLMYLDKGIKENEGKKRDTLLLHEEVYRYSRCNFSGDVTITNNYNYKENGNYNYISFNIFENCDFRESLSIKNIRMNSIFINFSNKNNYIVDKNKLDFKEISILECDFDSDFRLNGFEKKEKFEHDNDDITDSVIAPVKINKIFIKNTKFNKKLEIKNAEIKDFSFINSNVDGIFDAYKSVFLKAKFYKSIFKDFAAFEYVIFGDEKKENITDFIYTTFKDFSNFRNTKFKSGLNFSSANIKQEPNFLNTYVNLVGTDRETLRIIKNSFEKVNNKIESNRFFIYEMMRYKKEVNDDVDESIDFLKFFFIVVFSCNEYVLNIMGSGQVFKNVMSAFSKKIVLSANYYISRFGESYIQPLMIFLFSIGSYTYILEVHKDIFSEEPIAQYVVLLRNFVTQDWFVSLSKFLNACAANVPLFSKALENKSGIEFISLLFFIWFGILTWQIVVAVKRNTQH